MEFDSGLCQTEIYLLVLLLGSFLLYSKVCSTSCQI